MKVLLVSGKPLDWSGGLALDYKCGLEEAGCTVDTIAEDWDSRRSSSRIGSWLEVRRRRLKRKFYLLLKPASADKEYSFPVSDKKSLEKFDDVILSRISSEYDFVLIVFWWRVITSHTIRKISEEKGIPVIAVMVDEAPLTGGCLYPQNCVRLESACGLCPALYSFHKRDISQSNFREKIFDYERSKLVLLVNSQIRKDVERSRIAHSVALEDCIIPVDPKKYYPIEKEIARSHLNLPKQDCFIVFAGAANLEIPRKGFKYLIEAVNIFYESLPEVERSKVLILLAGRSRQEIDHLFKPKIIHTGLLGVSELKMAYSAADLYLSPSLCDAGPSMVNQSLMCGTPVISFDVGTALDCITNGKNGYRVNILDIDGFAEAVRKFYDMDEKQRQSFREYSRSMAVTMFSTSVVGQNIIRVFKKHF